MMKEDMNVLKSMNVSVAEASKLPLKVEQLLSSLTDQSTAEVFGFESDDDNIEDVDNADKLGSF